MTILERRLASEWDLMQQLAERNPGRITCMSADGSVLSFGLYGPAATPVNANGHHGLVTTHSIRIEFPVHFPAVPMEMFLTVPVVHPNIHPETGFVCLWERHLVSNTVEHALHKTVAMLAGDLRNTNPIHVMQPAALGLAPTSAPMPLLGVVYDPGPAMGTRTATARRRRLE